MRLVYRAERVIRASPDAVWAVLVDLPAYAAWNPFTSRAESTLSVGDPVVMRVDLGWRTVTQTEVVREVTPPRRLVWGADIPVRWLLRAERVQTLDPVEGGTRYVTVDTIEGPMAPLVALLFGLGLARGFDAMAEALARRVESLG